MSHTDRADGPAALTAHQLDLLAAPDPFGLVDRHAAWLAGYQLGLTHGRQLERTLIDQEAASRAAGRILSRLADFPEVDRAETRRQALLREARWAS